MRRLFRHPGTAIFALCFVAYSYFYQAGGWNQNSRFNMVRTAVEDRSWDITRFIYNTGDTARRNNRIFCDKAPGASLLAAVAYAPVYWIAGTAPPNKPSPGYLAWASYVCTVFAVAIPSALAVALLFLFLGAFGLSRRRAALFSLLYAFATMALPYSTLFFGHQTTAALALISFCLLALESRRPVPRSWLLLAAGLLAGWAVVVEYPSAITAFALTAYAALWVRPWKKLAWWVLGGAIAAVALGAYHWDAFGGPFTLPYEFSTQSHRGSGFFMGIGAPIPEAIWGITFSTYRGLFFTAPWLLLAFPGAYFWWRAGKARPELVVASVITVFTFWLNMSLEDWQGGWTLGPRYLVPALPFMAFMAAGMSLWIREKSSGFQKIAMGLMVVLGLYSAFMMLVGTAITPMPPVYVDAPYGDHLLPALKDGLLAISTQSIDMPTHVNGGAQQAWNLGHKLGLSGLATLLPLFVALAGLGAWLRWALRQPSGGLDGELE